MVKNVQGLDLQTLLRNTFGLIPQEFLRGARETQEDLDLMAQSMSKPKIPATPRLNRRERRRLAALARRGNRKD